MNPREQYIRQRAAQLGLDPNAVVAIASVEGSQALHGGDSIGDHGTSFGPFQLHEGGALPQGKGNAWANSTAGINYALGRMATVAGGLKGKAAVSAISSKFERPADVAGEIQKAMGFYGGGAPGGDQSMVKPLGGSAASAQPDMRSTVTSMMFGAAQMLAAGQQPDLNALLSASVLSNQLGSHAQALGQEAVATGNPGTKRDLSVVATAKAALGTPYVWGGTKPGGFDCSGLLQYTWAQHGVSIPRTTYDQFKTGQKVNPNQLRAGDAVFFTGSDSKGGLPGHVGMYIGGGKFIEAPHTGSVVRVSNLDGRSDFVGARRYG